MCWGKGACPNSKCNQELIHTDGRTITSRKSLKYTLWGNIQQGEVSLTISNANQGDSGVYCCRIEVPGWFNDVKKTVRLELRRGEETMGLNPEREFCGLWYQIHSSNADGKVGLT
ncbi:T cell immunoglobulin and mucin domain containing 4 [Cricetulus griseus]